MHYSKLEMIPTDLKLKVLKDVIGRSATTQQAVQSTRIFIFTDRKLCAKIEKDKLCCIIQLLADGCFRCNVGDVTLNHLISEKPQSKAAQHILEEVKKLTLHELECRHPLLKTSQRYFDKFYDYVRRQQQVPENVLDGLELNYYHRCESSRCTPLLYAVKAGTLEAVQQLIAAECNLEKSDNEGNTPLHKAASLPTLHNKQLTKALIEAKANLNAQNKRGETPLILATKNLGFGIRELLIQACADENIEDADGHIASDYIRTFTYSSISTDITGT